MRFYGVTCKTPKRKKLRPVALFRSKADAQLFARQKQRRAWKQRTYNPSRKTRPNPFYEVGELSQGTATRMLEATNEQD